jgi:predicted O-methyltransferase YrrM
MDPHAGLKEISESPGLLRRVMCAVPGLRWLYHEARRIGYLHDPERAPFILTYPAGHYYSPLPTLSSAVAAARRPRDAGFAAASAIDMRVDDQLRLLREFAAFRDSIPFASAGANNGCRYNYDNSWFEACDAVVLHAMLRHFRPTRVVEIGSGYSSAAALDTVDRFLDGRTAYTFIEPNPYRLEALLRGEDRKRHTVIKRFVWDEPLSTFAALRDGDFLFIDTSHVVKAGSDVQFLFFEVLPCLAPGVIVHLHDIFWPFEYPEDWFRLGRAYNENYLVQAFLMYNKSWQVLFFNHYLQVFHEAEFRAALPTALQSRGSSLWLRKLD